jgi:hypothetical protein
MFSKRKVLKDSAQSSSTSSFFSRSRKQKNQKASGHNVVIANEFDRTKTKGKINRRVTPFAQEKMKPRRSFHHRSEKPTTLNVDAAFSQDNSRRHNAFSQDKHRKSDAYSQDKHRRSDAFSQDKHRRSDAFSYSSVPPLSQPFQPFTQLPMFEFNENTDKSYTQITPSVSSQNVTNDTYQTNLSTFGYSVNAKQTARHKSLQDAIVKDGVNQVRSRLVYLMNKYERQPDINNILQQDLDWVELVSHRQVTRNKIEYERGRSRDRLFHRIQQKSKHRNSVRL